MWVATIALGALAAGVYAPSLAYEFIYDDHELIVKPPPPQSAMDVLRVFGERHWYNLPYYRPVARLTMVGQRAIHGQDPAPFHAFNVLAMSAMAATVFHLYRWPVFGIHPALAFFAAALIAVHPIASCTVYPICSGRETLLPALFSVAAVYAYLRAGLRWYAAAIAMFTLALLSKEQAIVVPLLFALAEALRITAGPRPTSLRGWLYWFSPIVLIACVYGLARWYLFRATGEHRLAALDDPAAPAWSILYFLQTAVTPFSELVYEPTFAVWFDPQRLAIVLIATVPVVLGFAACRPAGRRVAAFWLSWLVITLLPSANILLQQTQFAERWGFLSLVGLVGLIAFLCSKLWSERPAAKPILAGSAVVATVACTLISMGRGPYYRDDLSFHSQWVQTNADSDQAHRSLGWALIEAGRPIAAEQHLRRAIRLNPTLGETWNNLGNALKMQGRLPEAAELYVRALDIQPEFAEAHNNLGTVLAQLGNLELAEKHFRQAIRVRPSYSEAHNGLGIICAAHGRLSEARARFEAAVEFNPDNAEAHNNLGNVLLTLGERERAAASFRRALRVKPDHQGAVENLRRMRQLP